MLPSLCVPPPYPPPRKGVWGGSLLWPHVPGTVRTLGVRFVSGQSEGWRQKFLFRANTWNRLGAGIAFADHRFEQEIVVSADLGGGNWSTVGKAALYAPPGKPTCNIALKDTDPGDWWRQVVVHEAGHVLGLYHAHQHPEIESDLIPSACYAYFLSEFGWAREKVDQAVLSVPPVGWQGTPDRSSVMGYAMPALLFKSGVPTTPLDDPTPTDVAQVLALYPGPRGDDVATAYGNFRTGDKGLYAFVPGSWDGNTNSAAGWERINLGIATRVSPLGGGRLLAQFEQDSRLFLYDPSSKTWSVVHDSPFELLAVSG